MAPAPNTALARISNLSCAILLEHLPGFHWSPPLRPACAAHHVVQITRQRPITHCYGCYLPIGLLAHRRKVEDFDAEKAGTIELDPSARDALADPFAKLEHTDTDKRRAMATYTQIETLQDESLAKYKDDYAANKLLRRQMRGARKEEKSRDERRRQLGLPDHIKLLPENQGDALRAAAQSYGGNFDASWKHSRRKIAKESIFSQPAVAAAKQKKRPAGGGAAGATAPAAGSGSSSLSHKQRRIAPNVKLRLSDPKAA